MTSSKPRVGVSACLIGWEVRHAGGHKWTAAVAEDIGRSVEWIPVCPELEIGLGVPREAIELVGESRAPGLIAVESRRVLTGLMQEWAAVRLEELDRYELSGYVLKVRSPSCGPRVPVSAEALSAGDIAPLRGAAQLTGTGLFARALMNRFPDLPIVDETELSDPQTITRFLAAVSNYWRSCRLR
ncbi:MAG: DUF523 domain-containing protein [Candidatus Eisenbacteria bacterium]|nr:DUF523 domain-containing protein [Candidatus Eisenbacteria bacterium]